MDVEAVEGPMLGLHVVAPEALAASHAVAGDFVHALEGPGGSCRAALGVDGDGGGGRVRGHCPDVVGEVLAGLEEISVAWGCGQTGAATGEEGERVLWVFGPLAQDGAEHGDLLHFTEEAEFGGVIAKARPGAPLAACCEVFTDAEGLLRQWVGVAAGEELQAVVGLRDGGVASTAEAVLDDLVCFL